MSSVRGNPRAFLSQGGEGKITKSIHGSTPQVNRQRAFVLFEEGSSPIWVSQKLKRNSLVHLSIVYKVQHSLSISLGTPKKKVSV